MSNQNSFDIHKVWLSLASFVVVIAGIKAASSIVVPFLLSIFIATVSAPAIFWLEKLGLPRIFAFLIVLFFVISVLFGLGYILTTSVDSFLSNTPQYTAKIMEIIGMLQGVLDRFGMQISQADII